MSSYADVPAESAPVGATLRLAIGRLARRLKQVYAADALTFAETSVLSRLEREGPSTPTVLAAAEHVRPQAMGATLTALEQRGLIQRRDDPGDGRRVLVGLTDAGRQALDARHKAVTELIDRALASGFTPAECQALAAAIPLLDRLAERL